MELDEIKLVRARYYSPGALNPTMIVLHDMEAGEFSTTAENCAAYFAGPNAPRASANYNCDNNSTVCSVPVPDAAWHSGVGEINRCSIGIEQAGFASQSPGDWDDQYSHDMIYNQVIPLMDALCRRYPIARVWLTAADIRAGKRSGITSHAVITEAFSVRGGHTDPGPNYPVDAVMRALQAMVAPPAPPSGGSAVNMEKKMFRLKNVDGREEIFMLSPEGKIVNVWEKFPGSTFGAWAEIKPGMTASSLLAEVAKDGRLCVTVAGPFGILFGTWQSSPGSGPWVDWFDVNKLKAFLNGGKG